MTAEVLMELAGRCEAATGADRELMVEAFAACHPAPASGCEPAWRPELPRQPIYHAWKTREVAFSRFVAAEAWLDAAMLLVPDNAGAAGERFRLEAYNSPGVLAPHVRASAWVAGAARVYAATPALALCAAALRSRANMETPSK